MKKGLSYILLASVLLFACDKGVTKAEVASYLANPTNGTSKVFERDGFKLLVQYRPSSLLAQQDVKSNPRLNADSLATAYAKYYHFILSLSLNGKDVLSQVDRELYNPLLEKFNRTLNENVFAIEEETGERVPLFDWFLNRSYGLSNSTDIFCVFEASKFDKSQQITICFKDLLATGESIKIVFNKEDLKNIPKITEYES